jgi:glycosyltransferase involved in cell wall biosynthesis
MNNLGCDELTHSAIRVAILSSESPDNACALVRLSDVLKQLAPIISFTWNGISRWKSFPHKVMQEIREADVVVIQRSFPRFETIELMQWVLFESGKPVVYETDDQLTAIPESHSQYRTYLRYRSLIASCIVNCDAVIVSTEALKDFYTPLNPRIYVHSNTLNESMWFHPLANRGSRSIRQPIIIGFAGSTTHVADLAFIEEALERIRAKFGERVRFMFFGCITDRLAHLPGLIHKAGFLPYNEYPALLRSLKLDIGLAPLDDSTFNSCKSNIKYLEYAACGIPGIYSELPAYQDSVRQGVTGFLVKNTPQSWFDAIETLVENSELAEQIASAAFEDVWNRFSMHKNAKTWLELMGGIVAEYNSEKQLNGCVAKTMWEQVVAYEQCLAESKSNLNHATDQIRWLENHPLLRIYRVFKGWTV